MTPLATHVAAFLRERLPVEQRASQQTIDTYAHAFRLLFLFTASQLKTTPSQLHLEQIDASVVLRFLEHIELERGNGPATRNARLAAIKSFMHYIEFRVPSALEQVRQIRAIPTKKTDKRLVAHLTMEEVQAILDAPDPRTRLGTRDRAMLHVCFAAGLRVSELVGLHVDDVSRSTPVSLRVIGKGRRERILPLWKETSVALRAWLSIRGPAPTPEIFLNARSQPMTRAGFEYVLKRHVPSAEEGCPSLRTKRVSPHVLRHSCAMLILKASGDIRKVALWLGHSSVQTTEMYLRADPTKKLEISAAGTPPSLRKGTFRAPDNLIALLSQGTKAEDYARRKAEKPPWIGPRRRLTVHNEELR